MKKIILFLFALNIALCGCTQKIKENDVPTSVVDKFKKDYPDRTDVKWEKKGSNYEALYKNPNEYLEVQYDKDGNVIQSEHQIEIAALPKEVKGYTASNFPGKNISEAYLITDKDGNDTYECIIEEKTYVFDSDGKYKTEKTTKIRK